MINVNDVDELRTLVAKQYRVGTSFCLSGAKRHEAGNSAIVEDLSGSEDVIAIDFSGLNEIVEYVQSDLVVCAQTGITVDRLNERLAQFGQWLPVDTPGLLIDCILSGDAGYLETGYGPMRSQVLGIKAVRGGGAIVECGGRVVKNVTGFDTTKLLVGSRGHLAWPVEAHLKLVARPRKVASLIYRHASPAALVAFSRRLLASGLPLMALEIIETEPRDFCLVVQVGGPEAMVNDIVGQILSGAVLDKDRDRDKGQAVKVLENELARQMLRAEQFPAVHGLELAASLSYLERLSEVFGQKFGSDWTLRLRPASGRLYLKPSGEADLSEALDKLRGILPPLSQSPLAQYETLNLAMSSAGCFRSLSLGKAQPQLTFLYSQLKAKFDPLNCFSPQVSIKFEPEPGPKFEPHGALNR